MHLLENLKDYLKISLIYIDFLFTILLLVVDTIAFYFRLDLDLGFIFILSLIKGIFIRKNYDIEMLKKDIYFH
jgi:hypothetical protein